MNASRQTIKQTKLFFIQYGYHWAWGCGLMFVGLFVGAGEGETYKFLNFLNFLEQFLFTILLGGEQFVFDNACFLLELLIFQLIDLRFDFGNFDCVLNERGDQEK